MQAGPPLLVGTVTGSARVADTPVAGASRSADGERWLDRIPVRSVGRIAIVPVETITRLEAEDNYVRLYAQRMYLHKETLTCLVARLNPARFLRVHRSHAVNLGFVRELARLVHGEYRIVLADGTRITSGRTFTAAIRFAFGLL